MVYTYLCIYYIYIYYKNESYLIIYKFYIIDKEEMEPTTKTLYLLTTQLQQIITFYKYIESQFNTLENNTFIDYNNSNLNTRSLASTLLTSEREVHRIFELFNKINTYKNSVFNSECKVKFKEDGKIFSDFLSCFEFGTLGFIDVKKDIKKEKEDNICKYFDIQFLKKYIIKYFFRYF